MHLMLILNSLVDTRHTRACLCESEKTDFYLTERTVNNHSRMCFLSFRVKLNKKCAKLIIIRFYCADIKCMTIKIETLSNEEIKSK